MPSGTGPESLPKAVERLEALLRCAVVVDRVAALARELAEGTVADEERRMG